MYRKVASLVIRTSTDVRIVPLGLYRAVFEVHLQTIVESLGWPCHRTRIISYIVRLVVELPENSLSAYPRMPYIPRPRGSQRG